MTASCNPSEVAQYDTLAGQRITPAEGVGHSFRDFWSEREGL